MSVAPALALPFFLHVAPALALPCFITGAPASVRFHKLIFSNVLVCLKLNEK